MLRKLIEQEANRYWQKQRWIRLLGCWLKVTPHTDIRE